MAITPAQLDFLKGQRGLYEWALKGTARDERERGTIFCQRDEELMHIGEVTGRIGTFFAPECPEGWRELGDFHTHRAVTDFPTYGDFLTLLGMEFTCIGTPGHWKVECFHLDKGASGYQGWESRIKAVADEAWGVHKKLPSEVMVVGWEKAKDKIPSELIEKLEDLSYKYFSEFMRGRRLGYVKSVRVFG